MDIDVAVDEESKYNLVIFQTFAKRVTTRQKQDYWSNMLYANALWTFHLSEQN